MVEGREAAVRELSQDLTPREIEIVRMIAQGLRNQYSIAYSPTNRARDGKFRKIKVELVNPATNEALRVVDEKGKPIKYTIIAKAGYSAPREVE